MIDATPAPPDLTLRAIDQTVQDMERSWPVWGSAFGEPPRLTPSASALSVAIDGPGLFVFQNGARREYGRLGAFHLDPHGVLSDADGRAVMGFRLNERGKQISGLDPVALPADAVASHRFSSFTIDEKGTLAGIAIQVNPHSGKQTRLAVPIARIALAVFDAPELLVAAGAAVVRETRASGVPRVVGAGAAGVGGLRSHSLESGIADLRDDFRKLWLLRRRAELQNAMASATDQCVRTAIGLVK